jgi:hypothetical protein
VFAGNHIGTVIYEVSPNSLGERHLALELSTVAIDIRVSTGKVGMG